MWADSKRNRRVRPAELRAAFMHVNSFTYGLLAIEWWSGDQIRSEKAGGRVSSRVSLLWPLCFRFVSLSSRSLFL